MDMVKVARKAAVLFFLLVIGNSSEAIELGEHPKVKVVADKLVADGLYSAAEIEAIFDQATVQQSILNAMMNPAEYKFTWGKYRKLFLKQDRIQQGVDFWKDHQSQLARAEKEYGVPASVIVAIIGVESKYGKFKGKHKVLDSLVSLVTGFPRRSKFFAGELEEFLILTKENNLDPTEILGSYAGAVGFPQFISSSYRNYAVDFNGDGKTDLINQVDDAIGSIANYFIENGWKPGEPVTSKPQAKVSSQVAALASRKRKVQHTAESLRAKGARLSDSIASDVKLGVLMMDTSEIVRDKAKSGDYIVRAGDTVCQIAEKKKVSCGELIRLNKINKRGDIFRGQRLKMPKGAQALTKANGDKAPSKTNDSKWEVASQSPAKSGDGENSVANADDGPQPVYFFTHRNFYAITQYNHSVLYAMAVHDLSQAIDRQFQALQRGSSEAF